MRLAVILLASVSLCAGSAIPLIPGDNSHYVEGVSRYFWMPDGNGVPHLVDTQEPIDYAYLARRNGADNQYWLYTRNNPTSPQILVDGNLNSVTSSNYDPSRILMVISHGWVSSGNSDINPEITQAVLEKFDANVIVLDWSALASNWNYFTSAAGVPEVGKYLGNFLVWLINNAGGNWNNVHLVGHSLGAHVVGNAGRQTGGLPVRVTGLDAALPAWADNNDRLTTTDGIYVEAIHTDGGLLGFFDPIADADFYPNGGKNPQPGCWISSCSHGRSYELFASSVSNNHLVGTKCETKDDAGVGSCSGSSLNMGNNILTKRGSGLFYLTTGSEYPY